MTNACANCKFCSRGDGQDLLCRRLPPQSTVVLRPAQTLQGTQLVPTPVTSWPLVRKDEWCGEFEMQLTLAS